jgi:preprotein translocase subunit SecG
MLIIAQIIVSIILIALVLLQERSSGLSGFLGGGGGGTAYQTRRGLEKIIFWLTIVVGAIFATLAIVNLLNPGQ